MKHQEIVEIVTEKARVVELVFRAPFTMAKLRCYWKGRRLVGYGFSKQTRYVKRGDPWNPEMGQKIAEGRAIHDLAITIEELGSVPAGTPVAEPAPANIGGKP